MGASGPECDCISVTYDNIEEIADTTATDCAATACPGTCENGGICTDVSSTATCVCKVESGFPASLFTGSLCEGFDFQFVVDKIMELQYLFRFRFNRNQNFYNNPIIRINWNSVWDQTSTS